RRLHVEAVSDGGVAGAIARADSAREWAEQPGAAMRRAGARSAVRQGGARGRGGEADESRVSRAVVPDASRRSVRVTGGADGTHLLAGLRARLEHGGSVRGAPASKAGRGV